MRYTKNDLILSEENEGYKCIVADKETAVFGRVRFNKHGENYLCYDNLIALSNLEEIENTYTKVNTFDELIEKITY